MAEEKQKRLLVKEYDLVCELTDCKYSEEKKWCSENDGITRQEAIKKIETHLKASTIKFSTTPDVVAEIALNALLEVQNER